MGGVVFLSGRDILESVARVIVPADYFFGSLCPLLVEAGKAAVGKWLAPDEFKPVTIDDYVKMRSIDLEMFKAMQDKGGVGYPWVDAITRLMRPAVAGIVLSTWAWLHAQGGTDAGAADAFAGAVGFYLFVIGPCSMPERRRSSDHHGSTTTAQSADHSGVGLRGQAGKTDIRARTDIEDAY